MSIASLKIGDQHLPLDKDSILNGLDALFHRSVGLGSFANSLILVERVHDEGHSPEDYACHFYSCETSLKKCARCRQLQSIGVARC